jgi:hypothetical protein
MKAIDAVETIAVEAAAAEAASMKTTAAVEAASMKTSPAVPAASAVAPASAVTASAVTPTTTALDDEGVTIIGWSALEQDGVVIASFWGIAGRCLTRQQGQS